MGKETCVTFKCEQDFADWLSKQAFDLDKTKSELIRCCLLLSVETIKAHPTLIHHVQFCDRPGKK